MSLLSLFAMLFDLVAPERRPVTRADLRLVPVRERPVRRSRR